MILASNFTRVKNVRLRRLKKKKRFSKDHVGRWLKLAGRTDVPKRVLYWKTTSTTMGSARRRVESMIQSSRKEDFTTLTKSKLSRRVFINSSRSVKRRLKLRNRTIYKHLVQMRFVRCVGRRRFVLLVFSLFFLQVLAMDLHSIRPSGRFFSRR